ncbi:sensor histidine kinase [Paenibacillus flagellatus]|nr:sensor histidine kinase [Paenibacillus flagellatus]
MFVERRPWHWIEWMLFIIYTLWFALGLAYLFFKPDIFGDIPFFTMLIALLATYVIPLAFWRPGYVNTAMFPVAVFATAGSLQTYLTAHLQEEASIILLPALLVGFLSWRRTMPFTVPAFVLLFPVLTAFIVKEFHLIAFFGRLVDYSLLFGLGVALRRMLATNLRMQKVLDENETLYGLIREQNQVLEQYASQIEQITLLEERNRLAVELHDTVGHTFTSVIMGMDAVSYLIESAPHKAKEKLGVLRDVTRNGLEEIRRSIHQISPQEDEGGLADRLSRLVEEFETHTGTRVSFRASGPPLDVAKQTKLTLVRCLQESLTNAKRHGLANTIAVSLLFERERLILQVQDDGKGTNELNRGFGLRGMEQRLASMQGSLRIVSRAGEGTIVVCEVPIAPKGESS